MFNHFDGSVDLLDDLDDHYTARTHKRERNLLIERLQTVCAEFSVRLTILGGDVHLAALGRFYSNPNLHIPVEADHRYMVNVVSSAITNKPPPNAIANLLASRNKIHHLNADTSWLLQIQVCPLESQSAEVFTILIDPWFTGPQTDYSRFLSKQEHVVPSAVSSVHQLCQKYETQIDAVCISHEWTDHCHKATLLEVASHVPVYATTVRVRVYLPRALWADGGDR